MQRELLLYKGDKEKLAVLKDKIQKNQESLDSINDQIRRCEETLGYYKKMEEEDPLYIEKKENEIKINWLNQRVNEIDKYLMTEFAFYDKEKDQLEFFTEVF